MRGRIVVSSFYRRNGFGPQTSRTAARHARPSDFEDAASRAPARPRDRASDRAGDPRDLPGEARIVISSAAPDGRTGLVVVVLGCVREQATGEILPAHLGRQTPTGH